MSTRTQENFIENEESRRLPIYILFLALGVLTLLPDSFFSTATDYWMYKFRDIHDINYTSNSQNRTDLQANFVSNYSLVSQLSMAVFILFTILFLMRKVSLMIRIITSLSFIISLFVFTIIFTMIDTDQWQKTLNVIALVTGFLINGSAGVFMVCLFELVARFPPGNLAAIFSGQSMCGILTALVQIFSLGLDASSEIEGLIYFLCGGLFVLGTTCAFLITLRSSSFFYQNFSKKFVPAQINKDVSFLGVLNKTKYYLLSIVVVMGSGAMLHPGLTSLVVSQDKESGSKWSDKFFVPVVTFLLYNTCAYAGRELANLLKKPKNDLVILALAICRTGLVPLIMFCNAQPRQHLSVLFNKDYQYVIFIIVFSFSYGFLINLCVVLVPTVATGPAERRVAMILLLVLTLLSSGVFSFLNPVLVRSL